MIHVFCLYCNVLYSRFLTLLSHMPLPYHVLSYTFAIALYTTYYRHTLYGACTYPVMLYDVTRTFTEEEPEPDLIDDEDVIKFHWDGKGRFMDVVKLTACLDEVKAAEESMSNYRER